MRRSGSAAVAAWHSGGGESPGFPPLGEKSSGCQTDAEDASPPQRCSNSRGHRQTLAVIASDGGKSHFLSAPPSSAAETRKGPCKVSPSAGRGCSEQPVSMCTDAPRKPLTGWRLRREGRGVKTDYVWAVDKQIIPETVPTFLTSSLLPHW